ncbi:hypothetical protein [Mycobacterium avium]|uniref:hypothetical protein n=1 Tax=Mycobacterium avium TaxID=1764 RepID=UPI000BB0A946|nr:hypothetical protein [Mycobacterium avium]PBA68848.1 hypothetical protein CKJ76_26195 [Mycobacterium avium]
MRIILTVELMAIAGLAVVTITTGNPTNRLTHSDVTAEQMQAKFTAWVVDHTYDYVTINKVACAASHRTQGTYPQTASCRFTSTLSPSTPYPKDNELGLTSSGRPTYLHDMPCDIDMNTASAIQSVRCPTLIGWIFRSSRQLGRA